MRALIARDYGGIDSLRFETVPVPATGENDILVRVAVTSLNPVDIKMLTGELRALFETPFPYVPGADLAGIVESVGSNVTAYRAGDRIGGAFHNGLASYAKAPADAPLIAPVPQGMDLDVAAALPVVGLAALGAIAASGDLDGRTIAIIGAGGSVGRIAVQLATARGARVIATGRASDAHALRAYGASDVIDFTTESTAEHIRSSVPNGVDVAIDLVNVGPMLEATATLVRPGGRLVSTLFGPTAPTVDNGVSVHYVRMDAPGAVPLATLYAAFERGEIRVDIAQRYPFERAIDAFRTLSVGGAGKIIITQSTDD
jgi:NADPH:quinone reductase-like Zn-dependent oxidoreductase